jgi:hypothetical protein
MNPPHDATQARCGACQQPVTAAVLRGTPDGYLLATCPQCGVVWGVIVPQLQLSHSTRSGI